MACLPKETKKHVHATKEKTLTELALFHPHVRNSDGRGRHHPRKNELGGERNTEKRDLAKHVADQKLTKTVSNRSTSIL